MIKVPPADKALIAERARLCGFTFTEYMQGLLHRDTVDADGRPTWAPKPASDQLPLATDDEQDEQLPMAG